MTKSKSEKLYAVYGDVDMDISIQLATSSQKALEMVVDGLEKNPNNGDKFSVFDLNKGEKFVYTTGIKRVKSNGKEMKCAK